MQQQGGIIPRAVTDIFDYISYQSAQGTNFLVRASYLQIYNESISDLLAPERTNLQIREDKKRGIYVDGLSEWMVRSRSEVLKLIRRGAVMRTTGSTKMNEMSSRSHAVFLLVIEQKYSTTGAGAGGFDSGDSGDFNASTGSVNANASALRRSGTPGLGGSAGAGPSGGGSGSGSVFKIGKLNLVDLAGSERVSVTGAVGIRLEESKKINQSLSALGNVIAALTDKHKRSHVPYRDSKLTRILEDSLGGNCKTTMLATISPIRSSFAESLSTVKFASRAKKIRNKALVNEDFDQTALIRRYVAELRVLRAELQEKETSVDVKRRLFELEDMRRRAEDDKNAVLQDMQLVSNELRQEREDKARLERRISLMQGRMLQGGRGNNAGGGSSSIASGAGRGDGVSPSAAGSQSAGAKSADASSSSAAATGASAGAGENTDSNKGHTHDCQALAATLARYKEIVSKQRDVLMQLTSRLKDKDKVIALLQSDLSTSQQKNEELETVLHVRAVELAQLKPSEYPTEAEQLRKATGITVAPGTMSAPVAVRAKGAPSLLTIPQDPSASPDAATPAAAVPPPPLSPDSAVKRAWVTVSTPAAKHASASVHAQNNSAAAAETPVDGAAASASSSSSSSTTVNNEELLADVAALQHELSLLRASKVEADETARRSESDREQAVTEARRLRAHKAQLVEAVQRLKATFKTELRARIDAALTAQAQQLTSAAAAAAAAANSTAASASSGSTSAAANAAASSSADAKAVSDGSVPPAPPSPTPQSSGNAGANAPAAAAAAAAAAGGASAGSNAANNKEQGEKSALTNTPRDSKSSSSTAANNSNNSSGNANTATAVSLALALLPPLRPLPALSDLDRVVDIRATRTLNNNSASSGSSSSNSSSSSSNGVSDSESMFAERLWGLIDDINADSADNNSSSSSSSSSPSEGTTPAGNTTTQDNTGKLVNTNSAASAGSNSSVSWLTAGSAPIPPGSRAARLQHRRTLLQQRRHRLRRAVELLEDYEYQRQQFQHQQHQAKSAEARPPAAAFSARPPPLTADEIADAEALLAVDEDVLECEEAEEEEGEAAAALESILLDALAATKQNSANASSTSSGNVQSSPRDHHSTATNNAVGLSPRGNASTAASATTIAPAPIALTPDLAHTLLAHLHRARRRQSHYLLLLLRRSRQASAAGDEATALKVELAGVLADAEAAASDVIETVQLNEAKRRLRRKERNSVGHGHDAESKARRSKGKGGKSKGRGRRSLATELGSIIDAGTGLPIADPLLLSPGALSGSNAGAGSASAGSGGSGGAAGGDASGAGAAAAGAAAKSAAKAVSRNLLSMTIPEAEEEDEDDDDDGDDRHGGDDTSDDDDDDDYDDNGGSERDGGDDDCESDSEPVMLPDSSNKDECASNNSNRPHRRRKDSSSRKDESSANVTSSSVDRFIASEAAIAMAAAAAGSAARVRQLERRLATSVSSLTAARNTLERELAERDNAILNLKIARRKTDSEVARLRERERAFKEQMVKMIEKYHKVSLRVKELERETYKHRSGTATPTLSSGNNASSNSGQHANAAEGEHALSGSVGVGVMSVLGINAGAGSGSGSASGRALTPRLPPSSPSRAQSNTASNTGLSVNVNASAAAGAAAGTAATPGGSHRRSGSASLLLSPRTGAANTGANTGTGNDAILSSSSADLFTESMSSSSAVLLDALNGSAFGNGNGGGLTSADLTPAARAALHALHERAAAATEAQAEAELALATQAKAAEVSERERHATANELRRVAVEASKAKDARRQLELQLVALGKEVTAKEGEGKRLTKLITLQQKERVILKGIIENKIKKMVDDISTALVSSNTSNHGDVGTNVDGSNTSADTNVVAAASKSVALLQKVIAASVDALRQAEKSPLMQAVAAVCSGNSSSGNSSSSSGSGGSSGNNSQSHGHGHSTHSGGHHASSGQTASHSTSSNEMTAAGTNPNSSRSTGSGAGYSGQTSSGSDSRGGRVADQA